MASLRKRIGKQQCPETTQQIRRAFFMGVLSHQRSLIQCGEELVMINHLELAKELFYQLALARFGGGARLAQLGGEVSGGGGGGNGGIHIQTVIAQALQCEDDLTLLNENHQVSSSSKDNDGTSDMSRGGGMLQVNDSNYSLAQHATARLVESSAMLEEYFSIRIELQQSTKTDENNIDSKINDDDNNDNDSDNDNDINGDAILTGLPVLLDGHCAQPRKLLFKWNGLHTSTSFPVVYSL